MNGNAWINPPSGRNGQTFDSPTFTGVAKFASGSAAAPSVTFTGTTGTGLYSPAAGQMNWSSGGTATVGFGSFGVRLVSAATISWAASASDPQSGGDTFLNRQAPGRVCLGAATDVPAGGAANLAYCLSSTSAFGVYVGSGAPTVSAAQGSIYLRSDGSSTSTRLYVNTNGSTGWTNVTTAA